MVLIAVHETAAERRGCVRHPKILLLAEWTRRWLGDELVALRSGRLPSLGSRRAWGRQLREVGFRSLDLDETFRAYGLVAASGAVEVGRIVEEANGAFTCVLVEYSFERPVVYRPRRDIRLHRTPGRRNGPSCRYSKGLCAGTRQCREGGWTRQRRVGECN